MTRSLPCRLQLSGLLLVVLAACSDEGPTGSEPDPDPVVHKEWAFLLYDDADFANAYNPLEDFRARFHAGDEVHVLALNDPATGVASMVRIDESGGTARVREMGEVNMGAASTVAEFLAFAREFYPANRYIMAFYDHGMAWYGSCLDETNASDMLTMEEMRQGLAEGGGVDLVLFTAPCNMGSLEAAYEVRDQAEIYVGSENTSGYIWWIDPMGDISAALHANPHISNQELAQVVIEALEAWSGQWETQAWAGALTMTAVRTDRLATVAARVDALSEAYLAREGHFPEMIDAARPRLTSFGPYLFDIHTLAQELLEEEQDQEIRAALLGLLEAMDDAVLAEVSGPDWPGAQGLTIFLPDQTHGGRLAHYTGVTMGLDFVQDTRWDELLTSYLGPPAAAPEGVSPLPWSTSNGLIPPGSQSCFSSPPTAFSELPHPLAAPAPGRANQRSEGRAPLAGTTPRRN